MQPKERRKAHSPRVVEDDIPELIQDNSDNDDEDKEETMDPWLIVASIFVA